MKEKEERMENKVKDEKMKEKDKMIMGPVVRTLKLKIWFSL